MRIGIDARFYGGSFAKGIGRYTEMLLVYLDKIDSPHEFVVFFQKENLDLFSPTHPEKFRKVLAPFGWYSVREQLNMPRLIRQQRVDLMHFPHFNVPMFSRVPFVVTIHDLIIAHYPTMKATTWGPVVYALKHLGYMTIIRHAVRKSKKIIAVSEFTKRDIVLSFGAHPNRVAVTYEAADAIPPRSSQPVPDVLKKFSIHQPYILYVGNAYPHKNIEGLIAAFKILKDQYEKRDNPSLQLVLVGKEDYFYRRIKKEEVDRLGLSRSVCFTGFATDAELSALYAAAHVYCYPSFYEGFGLPPLEAMAHGVPVVSSNQSCLPEVLGDAAAFVNPRDIEQMAKILYDISINEDKRNELRKKGFKQVAKYDWEKCARETLEIYEEALRVKSG